MSATHCPVCGAEWVECRPNLASLLPQPTIALYCSTCNMHRLEYPGASPDSAPVVYEKAIGRERK